MDAEGRPTIALVCREFWPFHVGGGLGRYARAAAGLLAGAADLTVILPDFYADRLSPGDARLPQGVRYEFVREPDRDDPRPFASLYHAWSAAVYSRLSSLYPAGGPDLIEFPDYVGEGAVTIQAKRSGDRALSRTRIVVGLHGTDEIHRVLNGQSLVAPEAAALTALERIALAGADAVFTPGGDVYGTYQRYYGADRLGSPHEVPHPFAAAEAAGLPPRTADHQLRLVHAGRYERRKGIAELVLAIRSLDRDDVRLTLLGRDTPTGPDGGSMLETCKRLAAGDARIEFRDQTDHAGVLACFAEHDVVVIPSRWEANANTAREALMVARPVLATPTGGLVRIIEDGVNGWLTDGTGVQALARGIERLLDMRDAVKELAGSESLRASLSRSVDNDGALAAYLGESAPEAPETTDIDVEVCELPHHPLDTAEPYLPAGGDAVAIVPPGAVLAPGFVERCARALASAPDAAYATTWAVANESWQARPLGNDAPLVETQDCGGGVLVVRRDHAAWVAGLVGSWELAGAGAWLAARELRAQGEFGVVVPEELVDLRGVSRRGDVISRRTEVEAALDRKRTRWPAPVAV